MEEKKKKFKNSSLNNIVKNIFYIIFSWNINLKKLWYVLFFSTIFETLGILSVFPLIYYFNSNENFIHFIKKYISNETVIEYYLNYTGPALVGIFFIMTMLSAVFRLLLIRNISSYSTNLSLAISDKFISNALYRPYSDHINKNSSEILVGIVNHINTIIYQILFPILTIATSTVIFIAISAVLLLTNFLNSIILVSSMIAIYLIFLKITHQRTLANSIVLKEESQKLAQVTQEAILGFRDIALTNTQPLVIKEFNSISKRLRCAQADIYYYGTSLRYIIEGFFLIVLMLVVGADYILMEDFGSFSSQIPLIAVLILSLQRVLPVVQGIYISFLAIIANNDILQTVINILKLDYLALSSIDNKNNINFNNSLIFNKVGFNYTNKAPIIKNLDFSILKGDKVAIIGKTGSGKSTLIDLISGLIMPNSGEILIDGVALNQKNNIEWQKKIAVIPQTIFLTDGSILDNVILGSNLKDVDLDMVKNALVDACFWEEVQKMTHHIYSEVGEGGVKISGGQRQRLGIARALYRNPQFLIMDESTNALDKETESTLLMNLLSKKEITILFVTHRLDSINNFNKTINL